MAELELSIDDALDALAAISVEQLDRRVPSDQSGEWLYIFDVEGPDEVALYVKVLLRNGCLVVSFHHRTYL